MGRLLTLLFLSATFALFYVKFIRPEDAPPEPPSAQSPPKETPITRLSRVVDGQIKSIFSSLDGKAAPYSSHELRQMRGSLADVKPVSREEQAMYQVAITLCDTLMEAIQERERCNRSLLDTRSKPYSSGLSADQKKGEEEKRAFFEGGIQHRWLEHAASHQKRVDTLYNSLREYERRLAPVSTRPAAGGDLPAEQN